MHNKNDNREYELYLETPDGTYVLIKDKFNAFENLSHVYFNSPKIDVLDLVNAVIIMNEV